MLTWSLLARMGIIMLTSDGSDDCLVLKDGWKVLVEQSGLQAGDVVMAMFYRHANCLEIKLNLL